jgi:tRNA/rRNA methyltransferase
MRKKSQQPAAGGGRGPTALETKAQTGPQAHPAGKTSPAIVLVHPQLGENIGTAARAMANFGVCDLRLVAPRDGWPNERARSAAAGADMVIEDAGVFGRTEEAIQDLHYVCATTARVRDMVKPVMTPESAVSEMRKRILDGQRCGILFGAERSGLDNDQLSLADAIITAPVDPAFASLNLAQAVLILCYEWLKQSGAESLGRQTALDGPAREGLAMPGTRPATRSELVGFFEQLESELDASGFLYPQEKRPAMVRNIRNLFQRVGATEQDVRTLRGIVASLTRGKGGNDAP